MNTAVPRRRLLGGVASGVVVGLAGCLGEDDPRAQPSETSQDSGTNSPEAVGSDGLVYAFAPEQIAIIDPETGDIVDAITDGVSNADWGDTRITSDHTQIFAIESTREQVVVIDTETRTIAEQVGVGTGGNHLYHPTDDEVWVHVDDEGAFYVLGTNSRTVETIVDVGLENEGHGKLLAHPDLGSKAYGANVNDAVVHVIDLDSHEVTDTIELDGAAGTHYKAYAPETGLAYFERSGGAGTTAVIDTETDTVVDELGVSGGMYLTPTADRIGVVLLNGISVFDATSDDSEPLGEIDIAGNPSTIRYYETDEERYGFTPNADPSISVLDLDTYEEIDRIEVGETSSRRRPGVAGGEYFITTADEAGTVTIVSMAARERIADVAIEPGVSTVQYVGDSGVGYTGQ